MVDAVDSRENMSYVFTGTVIDVRDVGTAAAKTSITRTCAGCSFEQFEEIRKMSHVSVLLLQAH